jgi:hypothetical protein
VQGPFRTDPTTETFGVDVSIYSHRRGSSLMYLRSALAITLGLVLFGPAGSAPATTTETKCLYAHDAFISPGQSTSPSSGSWTSKGAKGETGTVTCDGPVNGKQPTGPGILEIRGRYGTHGGDTCQSGGEGDAVFAMTFPTSGGSELIVDPITFEYGAFSAGAPFRVEFRGDRVDGRGEVQPIEGDCVTQPVTRMHAKGQLTLKG